MYVLNGTTAVFSLRYPVKVLSVSATSSDTDIMRSKIPLFTPGKHRRTASLHSIVEFNSGIMRCDPKSTLQYQHNAELCNEGKPI